MAQETLYNKYKKIVKFFLKNKYSTYSDIDDDVSEILIKVFLNLNTFDKDKSKFKSWVLSIARNHMVDKWRCGCITTVSLNSDWINNVTGELSVSNSICSSITNNNCFAFTSNGTYTSCNADFENCSSINYISSQISKTDYNILNMKYVQGYNYCEIGSEFNITSNTVSNRVNYIKTKLKKNNTEYVIE